MENYLDNGAVLPSGLLGENDHAMMGGFNKSYKNYPLRVGVITASYPASDPNNKSKLTTEYDVMVIEQNEDRGATTIKYRNCLSAEGFGSIADFFEVALRPQKKKTTKGNSINTIGQDGAIVLVMFLDGMSDKGVIIGCLTHPNRETTLTDEGPYLEGEYNGVNIKVNKDGSSIFTFNGATDNQGEPLDDSQGTTILQVEKDGSIQVNHDAITFRLDRQGTATLTTKKDLDLNISGNVNIMVTGDVNVQCENATVKTNKAATVNVGSDAKVDVGGDLTATVSGTAKVKAKKITLNGEAGQVLTTESDKVIDSIFGEPTVGVPDVKAG